MTIARVERVLGTSLACAMHVLSARGRARLHCADRPDNGAVPEPRSRMTRNGGTTAGESQAGGAPGAPGGTGAATGNATSGTGGATGANGAGGTGSAGTGTSARGGSG